MKELLRDFWQFLMFVICVGCIAYMVNNGGANLLAAIGAGLSGSALQNTWKKNK